MDLGISPETAAHFASHALPMNRARRRDWLSVAWLISLGFSTPRSGPRPRHPKKWIAAGALPAIALSTIPGIMRREFFFSGGDRRKSGATFRLTPRQRRLRVKRLLSGIILLITFVAVIIGGAVAAVELGIPSDVLTVVGRGIGAPLGFLVAIVLGSAVVVVVNDQFARRARRASHWTDSKSSSLGPICPPPRKPMWVVGSLACDESKGGAFALIQAGQTLRAEEERLPAGEVLELRAASPDLLELYTTEGFSRWHASSLAMWRAAGSPRQKRLAGRASRPGLRA
jgi:hypothetical protein